MRLSRSERPGRFGDPGRSPCWRRMCLMRGRIVLGRPLLRTLSISIRGRRWKIFLVVLFLFYSCVSLVKINEVLQLTSCQLLSENVSSKKTWPAAATTVAMAKDASKSVALMLC